MEPFRADEEHESDQTNDLFTSSDPVLLRDFNFTLPLFSINSASNQNASNAKPLPDSDQQVLVLCRILLGDFSDLHGYEGPATTWPLIDINYDDYSVPIFSAGTTKNEVWICEDEGVLGWAHPKFGIDTQAVR